MLYTYKRFHGKKTVGQYLEHLQARAKVNGQVGKLIHFSCSCETDVKTLLATKCREDPLPNFVGKTLIGKNLPTINSVIIA